MKILVNNMDCHKLVRFYGQTLLHHLKKVSRYLYLPPFHMSLDTSYREAGVETQLSKRHRNQQRHNGSLPIETNITENALPVISTLIR